MRRKKPADSSLPGRLPNTGQRGKRIRNVHRPSVLAELGHSQMQKQATVNGTIPGQAD
jgi:hypothetical protein